MFELHDTRVYSSRSPADTKDQIGRNKIDYILIKNKAAKLQRHTSVDVNKNKRNQYNKK